MFELAGGFEGIDKVLSVFYQKVSVDPLIVPFFVNSNIKVFQEHTKHYFGALLEDLKPMLVKV